MFEIPTIDLIPFNKAPFPTDKAFPSPAQAAIAEQVNSAFRENGFIYVRGINLSDELFESMFRMSAELFSLPLEEKMGSLMPINRKTNTGYIASGVESLNKIRGADLREAYNFSFNGLSEHDFRGCPEGFIGYAKMFWTAMFGAARIMAIVCAVSLGLPYDHFLNALGDGRGSICRLLHYPAVKLQKSCGDGEFVVRTGEHTDFGLFTFLFTDGPGLQVKAIDGGELHDDLGGEDGWLDIPVPPRTHAIVNLGALMARATNDVWRAAAHRVVAMKTSAPTLPRLSIACFFDPDRETVISVHPNFVPHGESPKYEPIKASDYVMRRLTEAQSNA